MCDPKDLEKILSRPHLSISKPVMRDATAAQTEREKAKHALYLAVRNSNWPAKRFNHLKLFNSNVALFGLPLSKLRKFCCILIKYLRDCSPNAAKHAINN